MSDAKQSASGGIGLSGAVFIVFLVLRLTDHIDWAWYWVAAPLWMPVALVLGLFALFGMGALILDRIDRSRRRKAREKRAKDGKPATTETFDRIGREWADDIVRRHNEDQADLRTRLGLKVRK